MIATEAAAHEAAGILPLNVVADALRTKVMTCAAAGELRIDTDLVGRADLEAAVEREQRGRRMVVIP